MPGVFDKVPAVTPPVVNDPAQSQLPEELKGKTADEVYAALSTEHNNVMTQAELKHQTELAGRPAAPVTPKAPTPPAPVFQQENQEEAPDLLTNPDGFMDHQFNRRLEPLARQTLESQRATNKEIFQSKIGEDEYGTYGEEIESFVDKLHPALQGNFKSYNAAYDYVRSHHVDEISETLAEKKATVKLMAVLAKKGYSPEEITEFISTGEEPAAPIAPTGLFGNSTGLRPVIRQTHTPFNPNKVGAKVTDPQERAMMAEFGMTDAEYIEYKDQNSDAFSEIARRSK